MPHQAPTSHPARERMLDAGRQLPGVWDAIADLRSADLPAHACMYATEAQVADAVLKIGTLVHGKHWLASLASAGPLDVTRMVQPYVCYAAWRMTQGIYRVDPTLYADLIRTPITGDLPADVLLRLPEWCIYVETPGLPLQGVDGSTYHARGAWCRTYVDHTGPVLVIAPDVPEADIIECQHVPLGRGLREALTELVRDWRNSNAHVPGDDELDGALSYVAPVVNLLLYICSTSDISGRAGRPGNPQPTRTKRGPRLFPASAPSQWDVGLRMGAALRAAHASIERAEAEPGPGITSVRPHIRRAHWHTILSGPRLDAGGAAIPAHLRRADLRWLPPIPVNLTSVDDLPAVVHPVRGA